MGIMLLAIWVLTSKIAHQSEQIAPIMLLAIWVLTFHKKTSPIKDEDE